MLVLLLAAAALAADLGVYRGALRLVDERYLWPERIVPDAMFRAAADRLESEVEWLQSTEEGRLVKLRGGRWTTTVRLGDDLAAALAELEDAVRAAGLPLDDQLDLRAEILRGALSTLDRHSVVLSGDSLERFDERLSGTLTGIGVTLRDIDGHLTVIETFEHGPAALAGMRVDDRVARIDGVSTVGMTPADATERIRGRAGTPVRLDVQRGATLIELNLVRQELSIPNVTHATGPRGVGVVKIEHFSEQTTANLQQAIDALRTTGALDDGLVVDLRGNTGGSLVQSAKSADMFVDGGVLVTTAGRNGDKVPGLVRQIDARAEPMAYDGPIIVLVDHETASGAEILAGALLHLDRALLIGETSFGKGTVQTLYPLAEGLKLKLTVAEYILDDDAHVATVGLVPDLALYPVNVEDGSAWYADAQRVRSRLGADTPLLHWPDAPGKDGGPRRDDPLEVAVSILTAGGGATRDELIRTRDALLPALAAQQDGRVQDALHGVGLDWLGADISGEPRVAAKLTPLTTPRAGETVELSVTVENLGPPLARAAIRLRSTSPAWDDLLLPVGKLTAGATASGRARVRLNADMPAREDRVVGVLECEGCEPSVVWDGTLAVEGLGPPDVSVRARLEGGDVLVEVRNEDGRSLGGVRATLAFPGVEGLELGEPTRDLAILAPGESHLYRLPIAIASSYSATTLPLQVEVRADGHGRIARWSVPVPRDGSPLTRDAPEVTARTSRSRQHPGTTTLSLRLADDDGIDHVVVFGGTERVDRTRWDASVDWNEEKLFWSAKAGKRVTHSVDVPVEPGTNRFTVIAEDKSGLRTVRTVYVYGDGEPPSDDGVAFSGG